ncbi:LysR family transcriptional regulator [Thalassotalea euphylliae]|uniref:LysR family transcriptional regulator n=1 Tax=Thalassotalea euphylliae TaxID=1655234 RepID=A0A3E0UEG9_9GAMM|nr:LysR family transcriptional regulator [Thalassotalea euphylliae]REL35279.1 LysR family transcriptional regulator [Thalassotalea euphylliae]
MDTADLEKFIVLANNQNMQQTAAHFQSSPSVISKALKRLESSLNTQLFDRVGKYIQLNSQGAQLLPKAVELVTNAKQIQGLFCNESSRHIRVAGPAIILARWASVIARSNYHQNQQQEKQQNKQQEKQQNQQFNSEGKREASLPNLTCESITFDTCFEQLAVDKVLKGAADIALVTKQVTEEINGQLPNNISRLSLGSLDMVVACAVGHPLAKANPSVNELSEYDFVVPQRSPYCGELRGIGCDGWNEQLVPRNKPVIADDLSVLAQLVKSGLYLGYVPSYWAREQQLIALNIADVATEAEQQVAISWQPELLNMLSSGFN